MKKSIVTKRAEELGCTVSDTDRQGSKYFFEIKAPQGKAFREGNDQALYVEWGDGKPKEQAFLDAMDALDESDSFPLIDLEDKQSEPAPFAIAKHSPGEWQITEELEGAMQIKIESITSEGHRRTVALVPFTTKRQEPHFGNTDDADAKLIQAAPRTLRALKVALQVLESGKPATEDQLTQIETAIRRAENG